MTLQYLRSDAFSIFDISTHCTGDKHSTWYTLRHQRLAPVIVAVLLELLELVLMDEVGAD
jgi:hypothetical protein